ncbi:MAG TPA: TetR/AcrR family transcriptional regulator [Acidimicrobiales bacterium]|jgi:AcrR family transcriptional regulator|nr:TetR/AcrR family transcriptional regulator [Acidimicrobiales bacterium]
MPTETWWNLPAEKRERVTRAAMIEFGKRGFSAGSLNVIAREADIAKGSLFQYFDDKLDMFTTICEAGIQNIRDAALDGVDVENDEFFPALHHIVRNWLHFFATNPVERGFAYAAGNEVDAEAGAAVRSVTSSHFVSELTPLVKAADARGEFAPGVPVDQVIAMVVLLLRHLDKAPYYPHVDPVLDLTGKPPAEVERISLELVDALERAYGRPRKRTKARS